MTRRAGSLFTGVLGLDMAATAVFGTELAWACDNDSAAAKVIEHRAPDVPNLGDITAVDWDQVEPVDLLTAGWPCQPWSTAGQRKGVEDERALWPEVAHAVRALRPRVIALENVVGVIGLGELARVADTLAALGYQFAWTVLGADEVGACHRRNRVFILGMLPSVARGVTPNPAGDGREQGRPESAGIIGGSDAALGGGATLADATGARRTQHIARAGAESGGAGEVQPGGLDRAPADPDRVGLERSGRARDRWNGSADSGDLAPDADGAGLEGREPAAGRNLPAGGGVVDWGIYTAAVRRWERVIGRAAPVPRVVGPRGGLKLNGALSEWMQGFPAGWITDVPGVSMNDALKLAGNSVNPYQAVAALRWLADQLAEGTAA